MARGISIGSVRNKIKVVRDDDVLPVSTGDNQPEVVEIGVIKDYIKEDIEEIEALTNIEIENLLNNG